MNWYYAEGDDRKGPVSSETLNQLVASGTVRDETLVWREGLADWAPWGTVRGEAATVTAPSGSAPTDDGTEVCAVSGLRLPRSRMVQVGDAWIGVEHRDEYFQKLREGGAVGVHLRPAGIGQRLIARFLDGLIMFAIFAVVTIIAVAAMGEEVMLSTGFNVIINLVQILVPMAFTTFFLGRYGATPGKMAFKIKVIRSDGSPLTYGRAFGRYWGDVLSAMILGIGYLIALGNPERRTLHDMICDTRVVERDA